MYVDEIYARVCISRDLEPLHKIDRNTLRYAKY